MLTNYSCSAKRFQRLVQFSHSLSSCLSAFQAAMLTNYSRSANLTMLTGRGGGGRGQPGISSQPTQQNFLCYCLAILADDFPHRYNMYIASCSEHDKKIVLADIDSVALNVRVRGRVVMAEEGRKSKQPRPRNPAAASCCWVKKRILRPAHSPRASRHAHSQPGSASTSVASPNNASSHGAGRGGRGRCSRTIPPPGGSGRAQPALSNPGYLEKP
jgi:hypothetical protein